MIEQPKRRPCAFTHGQLGIDLKVPISLVVLSIRIDGAVEEFAAGVTLRPDLQ